MSLIGDFEIVTEFHLPIWPLSPTHTLNFPLVPLELRICILLCLRLLEILISGMDFLLEKYHINTILHVISGIRGPQNEDP